MNYYSVPCQARGGVLCYSVLWSIVIIITHNAEHGGIRALRRDTEDEEKRRGPCDQLCIAAAMSRKPQIWINYSVRGTGRVRIGWGSDDEGFEMESRLVGQVRK